MARKTVFTSRTNGSSNSNNSKRTLRRDDIARILSTAARTRTPSPVRNSSNEEDTKYGKRRQQKKRSQALMLLLPALVALGMTLLLINNNPSSSSNWSLRNTKNRNHHSHNARLSGVGGGGLRPATIGQRPLHHPELDKDDDDDRLKNSPHYANRPPRIGGGGEHQLDRAVDSVTNINDNERMRQLEEDLDKLSDRIYANRNMGIRWVEPGLLPPLKYGQHNPMLEITTTTQQQHMDHRRNRPDRMAHEPFFKIERLSQGVMAWETEDVAKRNAEPRYNYVDYTKHNYDYPETLSIPPPLGEYPQLRPLKEIIQTWAQDELDHPPDTIQEVLMHFDYTKPVELEAAQNFRHAKLPFKLVNVPEVLAAGQKWTDDYLAINFDGGYGTNGPPARGSTQESEDNFFAFFIPPLWNVSTMGIPPTRNNDWTFQKWSQHAKYADHVGLHPNQPHFYWQAGVDKGERHRDPAHWTFISRDLPSLSSPTETFFVLEPELQKGIQCRFGERGVTTATHYDSGRNMIAMMNGAKRYILSPPRECSKLGIVNNPGNAIYRHSMLNFGHLDFMNDVEMPSEERQWLERAGSAESLSTVLKAGEVLYIPSFWFHYITSLQKSAQCNVRSGIDSEGDPFFGGEEDVVDRCDAAAVQEEQ